jgi:hypothetical protein
METKQILKEALLAVVYSQDHSQVLITHIPKEGSKINYVKRNEPHSPVSTPEGQVPSPSHTVPCPSKVSENTPSE